MQCLGIGIRDGLGFLGSLDEEQTQWLNDCSDDFANNFQECVSLVQVLSEQAANEPYSLPGKIVSKIYANPQPVLECLGRMSNNRNAQSFSVTCTDGARIQRGLKAAARASGYANKIRKCMRTLPIDSLIHPTLE